MAMLIAVIAVILGQNDSVAPGYGNLARRALGRGAVDHRDDIAVRVGAEPWRVRRRHLAGRDAVPRV
jgi:hypothetical protein